MEKEGSQVMYLNFFFNDTATTEIYTLSLHDALPISRNANAHINLAWLYAKKKEKKKALEHFRKAVFYDPTNGSDHLAYASYCLEQSMLEESLKEFHKASNLFIVGKRKADFKALKQRLQQRLKERVLSNKK